MIQPNRRRPPMPVVTALILFILKFVVTPIALAPWTTVPGVITRSSVRWDATELVVDVIVAGLFLALTYGLWRGSPVSRFLVLMFVAFSLVLGVAQFTDFHSWQVLLWLLQMTIVATVTLLLLIPTASRAWFDHIGSARGPAPNPDSPSETST